MKVENLYQDILIKDLLVNPENPRLMEEMEDEKSAINYLLVDITDRMKSLAQDVAEKGYVYDPPLVRQEKGKWKVYDGNRRVACVKLLHNPSIAEDVALQKFFQKLAATYEGNLPKIINCRIESDGLEAGRKRNFFVPRRYSA